MTVEASWNGVVVARSDRTQIVEGNYYFPRQDVMAQYFEPSDKTTYCPWKGTATYETLNVDGQRNADAAWTYAEPKEKAEHIRGHMAFWRGVETREV